jgi:hypothetical protein
MRKSERPRRSERTRRRDEPGDVISQFRQIVAQWNDELQTFPQRRGRLETDDALGLAQARSDTLRGLFLFFKKYLANKAVSRVMMADPSSSAAECWQHVLGLYWASCVEFDGDEDAVPPENSI